MGSAAMVQVVEQAEAVVLAAANIPPAGAALTHAVFRSIATQPDTDVADLVGHGDGSGFDGLPVGAFFDDAIGHALQAPGPTAGLAAAVREVASHVRWQRRPAGPADPDGFCDGHANTILIGPNGLEHHDEVTLGMTLMAPNVRYPDHHHPPEEFYVVLSPGEWRQGGGEWHEPGPGGVVVHAPDVIHAMRSGDVPLLALWFLRIS